MSMSDRYLDWKNLCVNKILFNVVYSQNSTLLMAKLVIFLFSAISQGKVVALDRWGGKWNHFLMTHRLTTDYAKNYCNRTLTVKVIVENVVTCFFGTRCIIITNKNHQTARDKNVISQQSGNIYAAWRCESVVLSVDTRLCVTGYWITSFSASMLNDVAHFIGLAYWW